MFWKFLGRLMPWLTAVGAATFTMLDVQAPGWYATGLIVVGTLIQLAIGVWAPKV